MRREILRIICSNPVATIKGNHILILNILVIPSCTKGLNDIIVSRDTCTDVIAAMQLIAGTDLKILLDYFCMQRQIEFRIQIYRT